MTVGAVGQCNVLIVLRGQNRLLARCIESLEKNKDYIHEVFVCNNGAAEHDLDMCREAGFAIHGMGLNIGYAAGVNSLLREVNSDHPLLLLNADVIVGDTSFGWGLGHLKAGAVIVGGALQDERSGRKVEGIRLGPHGFARAGSRHPRLVKGRQLLPSGALMFLDRNFVHTCSGLFEPTFAYYEDVLICLSALSRGLRVHVDNRVYGEHGYHFWRHKTKLFLISRNMSQLHAAIDFDDVSFAVRKSRVLEIVLHLFAMLWFTLLSSASKAEIRAAGCNDRHIVRAQLRRYLALT